MHTIPPIHLYNGDGDDGDDGERHTISLDFTYMIFVIVENECVARTSRTLAV